MLDSMTHRGPDDRGINLLAGGQLVLCHLRLSILDLSPLGHQPMSAPDQNAWIVYNGEDYNFREIRADRVELGYRFPSDSDTEVILVAYQPWGLQAINRFRGMFAFAVWDNSSRQLHLCRDRHSVKYYSLQTDRLAFTSELKGLVSGACTGREVNPTSLCDFVQYGYVSAPRAIFSDVETVPPGFEITVNADLSVSKHQYWTTLSLYSGPEAAALAKNWPPCRTRTC
jgi:asparagine synthase (glutamine-hydrolysing)